MGLWAALPVLVWWDPTLFGLLDARPGWEGFVRGVGVIWLVLGVCGLLFRAVQLTLQQNLRTAFVWITKILTDPFHDVVLYHRAPLYLLRGEMMDPMHHVRHG